MATFRRGKVCRLSLKKVVAATIRIETIKRMANERGRALVTEVERILDGSHECWNELLGRPGTPHRCAEYAKSHDDEVRGSGKRRMMILQRARVTLDGDDGNHMIDSQTWIQPDGVSHHLPGGWGRRPHESVECSPDCLHP